MSKGTQATAPVGENELAKMLKAMRLRVDGRKHDADAGGPTLPTMARAEDYDWSAEIARLPMPVLLVFADNDSISQKHVAEFFALLGGGVKEPGWQNTQLSKSRLAIVPGYSQYNFMTSPETPQIIGKFLADPLTNSPSGAAPGASARSARCSTRHIWLQEHTQHPFLLSVCRTRPTYPSD